MVRPEGHPQVKAYAVETSDGTFLSKNRPGLCSHGVFKLEHQFILILYIIPHVMF